MYGVGSNFVCREGLTKSHLQFFHLVHVYSSCTHPYKCEHRFLLLEFISSRVRTVLERGIIHVMKLFVGSRSNEETYV